MIRISSRHWGLSDTLLIVACTGLAGALRVMGIAQPRGFVFDEFYASDACLYAFGPQKFCRASAEISVVHPPLGKWLIAAGLELFGFNPLGWRAASVVAGTLSVAVVYVLARRLLHSRLGAALATGLLTFDFLHFVMSRTAMLDIFVQFFGLVAFLCVVWDGDRSTVSTDRRRSVLSRILERRWLIGAGIAGGAAVACKWSGVYLLAGVMFLELLMVAGRTRGNPARFHRIASESAVLFGALVIVPATIYVVSYVGRFDGTIFAWPWSNGAWARAFVARHQEMIEHHTGPLYIHPYMSPPWSWPLLKRPVLFYFRDLADSGYQVILAFGNPLVWWPALVAVAALVWQIARRRHVTAEEGVILVGLIAGYAPWFIITRQESFLYYLLPAVPFLYLAIAHVICNLSWRAARITAVAVLAAASVGMFSFFRPVLIGTPLSHEQFERRMLLKDCGTDAMQGRPLRPQDKPAPPPAGWCWV